jgi:hypothetical protein
VIPLGLTPGSRPSGSPSHRRPTGRNKRPIRCVVEKTTPRVTDQVMRGHARNEADKNMRPKSLKTKRGFDQTKNSRTGPDPSTRGGTFIRKELKTHGNPNTTTLVIPNQVRNLALDYQAAHTRRTNTFTYKSNAFLIVPEKRRRHPGILARYPCSWHAGERHAAR